MLAPMVKHADSSEAASVVRESQKARLRRLRQILEPVQADAARRAGVSIHSWSRMETPGKTSVDPVAVARWCQAQSIPADYIIMGRLDGLPDAVKRLVMLAEAEDEKQSVARQGSAAPSSPPPKRSPGRPKRNAGTVQA